MTISANQWSFLWIPFLSLLMTHRLHQAKVSSQKAPRHTVTLPVCRFPSCEFIDSLNVIYLELFPAVYRQVQSREPWGLPDVRGSVCPVHFLFPKCPFVVNLVPFFVFYLFFLFCAFGGSFAIYNKSQHCLVFLSAGWFWCAFQRKSLC